MNKFWPSPRPAMSFLIKSISQSWKERISNSFKSKEHVTVHLMQKDAIPGFEICGHWANRTFDEYKKIV